MSDAKLDGTVRPGVVQKVIKMNDDHDEELGLQMNTDTIIIDPVLVEATQPQRPITDATSINEVPIFFIVANPISGGERHLSCYIRLRNTIYQFGANPTGRGQRRRKMLSEEKAAQLAAASRENNNSNAANRLRHDRRRRRRRRRRHRLRPTRGNPTGPAVVSGATMLMHAGSKNVALAWTVYFFFSKRAEKERRRTRMPVPVVALVAWLGWTGPYWDDPRIHNMGNGRLQASLARFATRVIDTVSYNGRDIRAEILSKHTSDSDRVVDLCCGTGASTALGAVGVDTSRHMISEAKWQRGPGERFVVDNAETFGETNEFDVVTLFFALHEMPRDGRRRVLGNARRIARRRVVVCDISPHKVPSALMLTGEPYLEEYQRNIVEDLRNGAAAAAASVVVAEEYVAKHVLLAVIALEDDTGA